VGFAEDGKSVMKFGTGFIIKDFKKVEQTALLFGNLLEKTGEEKWFVTL